MKLITAIINPFKLDEVREALMAVGVKGVTAYDVRGYGHQKGHTELYRGAKIEVESFPRTKIEAAVSDEMLNSAISAIQQAASTGKVGDGKIFVSQLEQTIRIRTGETGNQAL